MRRGIENVRAELLEKALTYNFCKMIELKKRQLKQASGLNIQWGSVKYEQGRGKYVQKRFFPYKNCAVGE